MDIYGGRHLLAMRSNGGESVLDKWFFRKAVAFEDQHHYVDESLPIPSPKLGVSNGSWAGWKLSDMMFATRRSLSDARASVAKQLEQVHSSITATKRQLSSRIECVDSNIDECKELTSATIAEVSLLQGEVGKFSINVESVHHAVKTLETKIDQIEGKQEMTTRGVNLLCNFVETLENSRTAAIQASPSISSRPALEPPPVTHTAGVLLRTGSLPQARLSCEPPSPSIQESPSTSSREALERPQITPTSRTSSMPPAPPSPSSTNDASSRSGGFRWIAAAFGSGAR
ncbi:Protein of unknown function DUF1664 [Macleaya cordata]|uniref:DUF1664 domain-containing protein n=1 Tax=Macleaya cordata TaxID=56857 RepID=A0A200PSN9_MACCD|nr:Protein of unknown function DUF1664 [Macleaya cordata]